MKKVIGKACPCWRLRWSWRLVPHLAELVARSAEEVVPELVPELELGL